MTRLSLQPLGEDLSYVLGKRLSQLLTDEQRADLDGLLEPHGLSLNAIALPDFEYIHDSLKEGPA